MVPGALLSLVLPKAWLGTSTTWCSTSTTWCSTSTKWASLHQTKAFYQIHTKGMLDLRISPLSMLGLRISPLGMLDLWIFPLGFKVRRHILGYSVHAGFPNFSFKHAGSPDLSFRHAASLDFPFAFRHRVKFRHIVFLAILNNSLMNSQELTQVSHFQHAGSSRQKK